VHGPRHPCSPSRDGFRENPAPRSRRAHGERPNSERNDFASPAQRGASWSPTRSSGSSPRALARAQRRRPPPRRARAAVERSAPGVTNSARGNLERGRRRR